MESFEKQVSPAMIILPCPKCGRAVKILGRVRRVLCACGQVLLELEGTDAAAAVAQKVG
jgi:hypothetical protein